MKSKKAHPEAQRHPAHKAPFNGSVELLPPPPRVIEFVTAKQLWGIPLQQLGYFVLGENPERPERKTSPPDLLILFFRSRTVCLYGWRLEQMIDPLMERRVKRVHAEKYLGNLIIHEPWVSDIRVLPPVLPA